MNQEITITLEPRVYQLVTAIASDLGYDDLSKAVEHMLILLTVQMASNRIAEESAAIHYYN